MMGHTDIELRWTGWAANFVAAPVVIMYISILMIALVGVVIGDGGGDPMRIFMIVFGAYKYVISLLFVATVGGLIVDVLATAQVPEDL